MPYEPPPILTDLDTITDRIFDGVATRLAGWEPVEGSLDTAIIEEIGRETALTNNQAISVLDLAVVALGETVYGLPARAEEPAALEVDITVTATGSVIPAGFTVIGIADTGLEAAFSLPDAITAATLTVRTTLYATAAGIGGNGVRVGTPLTIATATATVVSVVVVTESAGGAEAETVEEYRTRLADFLGLLRVGAVRADDLEAIAKSITGVYRARAVDLYDLGSGLENVARTATVWVVGANGLPVSAAVKADIVDQIAASREVNFVAQVADPTYTTITIAFTAVADTGATPATVQAAAIAALRAYIHPNSWGSTPSDPRAWLDSSQTVRYVDLASVLGSVPGIAVVTSLTVNGGTADVVLGGRVGLPASPDAMVSPSVVTGTVTS